MAELTIDSSTTIANLSTWQIVADATPIDVTDTSAGAIQATIGASSPLQVTGRWGGKGAIFTDRGVTLMQGKVIDPSRETASAVTSVTVNGRLAQLNKTIAMAPFNGRIRDYITAILTKCGITDAIAMDTDLYDRSVIALGWYDNAWRMLNEMLSVEQMEILEVNGTITVYVLRQRTIDVSNNTGFTLAADSSSLADTVNTYTYNAKYQASALLYPAGSYDDTDGTTTPNGWTSDAQILTCPAYSSAVYEVPIQGSIISLQQPTCVSNVGPHDNSSSVYTVVGVASGSSGSDSVQTLSPSTWTARGGKVTVAAKKNDPSTLVITINAGRNKGYSSFALAINYGSGSSYSTLRVVGEFISQAKERFTVTTGASGAGVSDSPIEIDSIFLTSRDRAMRCAMNALPGVGHARLTLSGTIFTSAYVGTIPGSRFRWGANYWRITQATADATGAVQISAAQDTTFADFSAEWGTYTFAYLAAATGGKTFGDFAVEPLKGA